MTPFENRERYCIERKVDDPFWKALCPGFVCKDMFVWWLFQLQKEKSTRNMTYVQGPDDWNPRAFLLLIKGPVSLTNICAAAQAECSILAQELEVLSKKRTSKLTPQ